MSNGNDLKRIRVQFTYPKCMIMYSMKKKGEERGKQEKKMRRKKSASIFFDHQVRTGRGF